MFSTIKAKIIVLTFSLLCLLGIILTATALHSFYHDKTLIMLGNNASINAFEGQLNTEIAQLEKNALDLALIGEIYYQNGKKKEVGEFFAKKLLENYPDSMGNGIWFEPYQIDENQKATCIHALWENGRIELLPSCVRGDYDYFKQNWYAQIITDLKNGKHIAWARPYKSSQVEFLMTTVGTGIYDNGKLVGMAMVDWQMDTILKSLLKIKPTPNSFVLFADEANDYIIATTEPYVDNTALMGKSLKTRPWYSAQLQDKKPFVYHKKKYIPFIKHLNKDLVLIVNVPLFELYHDAVLRLQRLLAILFICIIFIVGLLYLALKRNINQPISKLTGMAEKIGKGNLNTKIHLDNPKELAQLAKVLNKMTSDIKTHIMNLAKVSHEKEKIESELSIAQTIQDSCLPKDFPKDECFELKASMTPAREVGGDFYDFFPIDEQHYAFVMADVSGKGITAALYMMSAKTIIKNMLQAGYSLVEAASKINKGLYDNHARGMFVTAFIGVLDRQTGRVDYINAGHCAPLHQTKSGYDYVPMVRNLMLGVMPNYEYKAGHFILRQNDCLFLYTDGVTEAQTKDEKLFGSDRLKKTLNQKALKKENTLDFVHKAIKNFTKEAPQSDDITMMEIKFHHKQKN